MSRYRDSKQPDAEELIASGAFGKTLGFALQEKEKQRLGLTGITGDVNTREIREMMLVLSQNAKDNVELMRKELRDGCTLISIAAYGDEEITRKAIKSFQDKPHDGNFHTNHIYWPQIEQLARESGNKLLADYVAPFSKSMSANIDRERGVNKKEGFLGLF